MDLLGQCFSNFSVIPHLRRRGFSAPFFSNVNLLRTNDRAGGARDRNPRRTYD